MSTHHRTAEQMDALRARIEKCWAEDPPLTVGLIAERLRCSTNTVSEAVHVAYAEGRTTRLPDRARRIA